MHCAGDPIASLANVTEKPAPWVANLRFPDACAMAISPFLAQLVNLKPGYRTARAVHFLGSVEKISVETDAGTRFGYNRSTPVGSESYAKAAIGALTTGIRR